MRIAYTGKCQFDTFKGESTSGIQVLYTQRAMRLVVCVFQTLPVRRLTVAIGFATAATATSWESTAAPRQLVGSQKQIREVRMAGALGILTAAPFVLFFDCPSPADAMQAAAVPRRAEPDLRATQGL